MTNAAVSTRPLGDLVSITRGKTYQSRLLGEPGPVLLGLSTIARNGGFREDSLRTYGGDSPENLIVRPGELFASLKDVTQSADLLGSVARLPEGHGVGRLTQDTVRLDLTTADINSAYLYYALLTPAYRSFCRSHATGTTNLGLPREDFLGYGIPVLPLKEQQRIAGVLGTFDNLIQTNRRLIENLDQVAIARADHVAQGASGEWRKFADVAQIGGGGTPSTKVEGFWGGDHPWATPKDITALPSRFIFDTPRKLTDAGLAKCSSPLRPVGSILMTSRATIGEFALAQVPLAVNQGFIVVTGASPADTTWLYFEMRRRTAQFRTIAAKGSTFPEISRGEFKSLDVRWPDLVTRLQLHREVAPLLSGAAELEREVAALTAQRDELLPLLMSGKVRVRDVEAAVR